MYCEETVVVGISANVAADDGLLVVDAVGRRLAGSGEADDNRVQRSLGPIRRGFTRFNVEGHKAAIADEGSAYHVATAVDAVDLRVKTVNTGKDINIATGFKHSIPRSPGGTASQR